MTGNEKVQLIKQLVFLYTWQYVTTALHINYEVARKCPQKLWTANIACVKRPDYFTGEGRKEDFFLLLLLFSTTEE